MTPAVMNSYKQGMRLMGNHFEITVVENDPIKAEQHIALAVAEIKRLEQLLTTFDENSQTNQINKQAGIAPVRVDQEVFHLIERSIRISDLTQGAFDLTYGSIDKRFWNFDTTMTSLPDRAKAKEAVKLINYHHIVLDHKNYSVFLRQKGMRIGFGGIGKGYAAECAKRLLQNQGVTAGIINASGDLCTWGKQPNGHPWSIGIADPKTRLNPFSYLELDNMSIATSGDYEKYVVINGTKYSHTIDPRSGYPARGVVSVSIISPNAELCDALTTPVMVMGIKNGLHLVNQIRNVGCIILDEHHRLFSSKNITIKNHEI